MKILALLVSLTLLLSSDIDTRFLAALDSHDIQYVSPERAISNAHLICAKLDNGQSPEDIATQIMQNSNLDDWHAGFFIGASIAAYCPGHTQ